MKSRYIILAVLAVAFLLILAVGTVHAESPAVQEPKEDSALNGAESKVEEPQADSTATLQNIHAELAQIRLSLEILVYGVIPIGVAVVGIIKLLGFIMRHYS